MKPIDMRCIRVGDNRANSHWACASRGFTRIALFFSMARKVSRASRSGVVCGAHALALKKVVASDESAYRALVEDRGFDGRGAHHQYADPA